MSRAGTQTTNPPTNPRFSPSYDDPSDSVTYQVIQPDLIAYAEIFPPIGIARVGNSGSHNAGRDNTSPIEVFLTPEVPHTIPDVMEQFRDKSRRIKRQAARFRLYAYGADGEVLGEINSSNGYDLAWTVDVANTKAATTIFKGRLEEPTTDLRNPDVQAELPEHMRSRLIVKPRLKVASTEDSDICVRTDTMRPGDSIPLIGKFCGSRQENDSVDVDLGEVMTDRHGRLVFVGGSGYAQCVTRDMGYNPEADYPTQPDITSEFDNVDWVDSTCDGWISVSYRPKPNKKTPMNWRRARHNAYVISGPPDFAKGIKPPTSLWDTIENIYNKHSQSFMADPTVQFHREIWPVLSTTYDIAWVNNDAFQGHGPNGSGSFLLLKDRLSNPNGPAKDQILREHIFNRLRMPDYLNKDQGSLKWMPRLSGDAGDAVGAGEIKNLRSNPDAIARFASLTTLQYDRFKRWKTGQFKNDPFPVQIKRPDGTSSVPVRIEDVPLQLQPEYLTRAHLESTIGDPLFPGIEVYWTAKTPLVYDLTVDAKTLNPPFRINPKLRPGDLTKGCSLPWQSDFSQCNTHWWPSARPDDVVVLAVPDNLGPLKAIAESSSYMDMLDTLPRQPWTRLMRETPDNDSQFFPGCTDMVRWWTKLGFMRRIEFNEMPHLFVETDRLPFDPSVEPQSAIDEGVMNIGKGLHDIEKGVKSVLHGTRPAAEKWSNTIGTVLP